MSPHSATRSGSDTIPLPFGPHTGQSPAAAASSRLQLGLARLGEPGGEHDRAAAAERAGPRDDLGRARRGDRHDDRVRRLGQVLQRRVAARARAPLAAPGLTAYDAPRIAEAREVEQRLAAVGARPLGRADDGDRARRERQRGRISAAPAPRRGVSSARATIRRWISLVPSQMRSTRSSRQKRSATLVRV